VFGFRILRDSSSVFVSFIHPATNPNKTISKSSPTNYETRVGLKSFTLLKKTSWAQKELPGCLTLGFKSHSATTVYFVIPFEKY